MVWRPKPWNRVLGYVVGIGMAVEACALIWQTSARGGVWESAAGGVALLGFSGWVLRSTIRLRLTLTPDTLIVSNTFRTYTVALTEITHVEATSFGLVISRAGGRPIRSTLGQKSRWAEDTGAQTTRGDDMASDIMVARSRLTGELDSQRWI